MTYIQGLEKEHHGTKLFMMSQEHTDTNMEAETRYKSET